MTLNFCSDHFNCDAIKYLENVSHQVIQDCRESLSHFREGNSFLITFINADLRISGISVPTQVDEI